MSAIKITREYPHSPSKVWRVITEPELMGKWGMRPEGFALKVGTRFRFVGEPNKHWRGYVDCEVLEVRAPQTIAYTWVGDDSGAETRVRFTLSPTPSGTRLLLEHTGFTGIGGFMLTRFILGPGWKKMLAEKLVPLLASLGDKT